MQTGMLAESQLGRLLLCILFLFSLIHLCLAAPGFTGTQGEGSHSSAPALANPFSSGDDDRRLLQIFIQASMTNGPGGPEISTREQEVFYMFGLYDYDHGGFLDGLELMRLVSEYNHHHSPGAQPTEQVVAMVDFLLQTQDLNQDGLLTPLELLSPPLPLIQDSVNNGAPNQEQGVAVEEKLPYPSADENTVGEETIEHRQGVHEEIKPQDEDLPQQEVKPQEEELMHLEEQHGQQIPEAQAAEEGQVHQVPVHQGQPEM
ncbi:cell growth regulator with EF hand domain protein 1 [Xyrichtys novacula]|uniref:Cell growth regulator with EF hand domain protein 1 n=1 Tax=Xyrichtys novacula TaxID=13765 RepID=A0AAV1EJT4_XYRNO|nr:cell growth regulator with EF hand domain protein 1 [Xyrichtys novacula]